MTIEAKKSVSKISLALLIIVISLASSQAWAHEYDLAMICMRSGQWRSCGYEFEHRKCFTNRYIPWNISEPGYMTWYSAKKYCQQRPRLPHFGPPELATIDLKPHHMEFFMEWILRNTALWPFWTGAHIPPRFVSSTEKNNNEWRWVADNSRLNASDPVWNKGGGYPEEDHPKQVCGVWTRNGLRDYDCDKKFWPLCQYKAE